MKEARHKKKMLHNSIYIRSSKNALSKSKYSFIFGWKNYKEKQSDYQYWGHMG